MSRISVAIPFVVDGKGNLESALPGEWALLVFLVVMTAVLGAAVLAGGLVRQRRRAAQLAERRQAYQNGHADAAAQVVPVERASERELW